MELNHKSMQKENREIYKDEEIKQHTSQNQWVRGVKSKIKIYFEMNRNRNTKCQNSISREFITVTEYLKK